VSEETMMSIAFIAVSFALAVSLSVVMSARADR
jgi:hypothetical protein